MKSLLLAAAAFAVASGIVHAQTLTVTASGYSGHQLITSSPGYTITAVATDGAGRLFYVESDANFFGTLPTKLWSVAFDGTTVGTPGVLHNFGANISGSFLKFEGSSLVFGESTTGGVFAIDPLTAAVDPLGSVPFVFDADFSGGSLFVSAFSGGGNKVTRYGLVADGGGGLALSSGTAVLDTGTENSGPVEFTLGGDLIYGSSATGLFRFSPSEVAAGGLTLDVGHRVLLNGPNSYLAPVGATGVWRDSYATSELQIIDTATANVSVIGNVGAGDSLGDLDAAGGRLVAAITDYSIGQSRIYSVVPEPSSAALAALGLTLLLRRQRRKRGGHSTILLRILGGAVCLHGTPLLAGPYAPNAGQVGSTAIAAADPSFVEWANSVLSLQRGPQNIANPGAGNASFGTAGAALDIANNSVVSLGDGGSITLGFAQPIFDGPGFDFAVFENGFASGQLLYLELGFVEVSSDGANFFRFPSISLTQTTTQVASFGLLDPTDLHNLAGKYAAGFGTPFDLAELASVSPLLDVDAVQYVRVVDVVGSINPAHATHDSLGNIVNDPAPTAFSSAGFDFDAVGVIHAVPEPQSAALVACGIAIVARRRRRLACAPSRI